LTVYFAWQAETIFEVVLLYSINVTTINIVASSVIADKPRDACEEWRG